jgi:hypothetical protein
MSAVSCNILFLQEVDVSSTQKTLREVAAEVVADQQLNITVHGDEAVMGDVLPELGAPEGALFDEDPGVANHAVLFNLFFGIRRHGYPQADLVAGYRFGDYCAAIIGDPLDEEGVIVSWVC